jgi:hypothetical protein
MEMGKSKVNAGYDPVQRPAHYNTGDIEVIDYIRDKLPADGFRAYCIGNVLKYISRYDKKGAPLEDLQKAQVYLNWAVETFGSNTKAEPEPEPPAEPPAEVKKPERKKPMTKATKKPGAKRKELDMGKITALRDAGWSIPKIADEMGVSAPTIRKHLTAMDYPDPNKDGSITEPKEEVTTNA